MNHEQLETYLSGLALPEWRPALTEQQQLFIVSTPGRHAEQWWREARERCEDTLRWPLIIGGDDAKTRVLEEMLAGEDEPPAVLIEKGLRLDVHKWIKVQQKEDPEYYELDEPDQDDIPDPPVREQFESYRWETLREPGTDTFLPMVYIAMVPTAIPWEVPAHIQFGGWNECPSPDVHVAFFKHWHEKWRAEPFAITWDTVEMHVRRPPVHEAQAAELAQEQYIYCTDIVSQGVQSIENLTYTVSNTDGWFFWWD